MSEMSTSLEDLHNGGTGNAPSADEERVKRILAEMNAGEMAQPPVQVPLAGQRVINEPPLSVSTGDIRMDAATARANVIGGTTPTMADFHSMFLQAAPGMAPFHGPAVVPGATIPVPKKVLDWKTAISNQLKAPVIVASIVFLLSLPVVTSALSRYAPWMYLGTGDISIAGLLVKAVIAGAIFLVYQTIASVVEK